MKALKSERKGADFDALHCTMYPEEKLVDYVLNRLTFAERLNIELHLKSCEACATMTSAWAELLEADVATANRESTNLHSAVDRYEPSSRVRRRLMYAAYLHSLRHRLRIHKQVVLRLVTGTLLIMLIAGLFTLKESDGQSAGAFDHTVNQRIADMQGKGTERYAIQPAEPFFGSGSVWLRRDSGEMLIVVNGLHVLEETDYQVWLQEDDQVSSVGFMLVQGPTGKSYYYGFGAEKAKRVVVSMEPKGGSMRPTGIEAVLVNMGP